MELAMGAMGPLFPKLIQLLEEKYVRQRGLKSDVESLSREMTMVHATLVDVSRVPPEQLSEQDKLWAQQIRELSYDMEDAIDAFMVRVARREAAPADTNILMKIARKATSSIKKIRERHRISDKIKDIKDLSKELSELHIRYAFSGNVPPHEKNTGIDPRVINLYNNEGKELVGINRARDQLKRMLMHPPENESLKIISIIGCGGLGKTTLAKLVYDQINKEKSFECCAFVSVGRHPNLQNTLREMHEKTIEELLKNKLIDNMSIRDTTNWAAERFCQDIFKLLQGKRYIIVVDDVWDKTTWDSINCILPDSNCGSKVIVTTRNSEEVSTKVCDVYKLNPLSADKSKELFYKRTSGSNNGDHNLVDKIIDKCHGVPLAIIAIASLLANRQLEDWPTVYDSLIFGRENDSTRTILLYSYYDLPSYLKPCVLYLSMYPDDCIIYKSKLIWRWIAEGFVQPDKEGGSLSEVGERYFNELMNRSMIDPIEDKYRPGIIHGCRVHDIVLDLIRDLSTEENFVTVLREKKIVSSEKYTLSKEEVGLHGSERKKVRRLSTQWSYGTKPITQDTIGMTEVVRSLDTGNLSVDGPLLSSFQSCRVLAMNDVRGGDLKHLGKLLNLRHLEIRWIRRFEFPKEIGNLKCLQTLIIPSSQELPPTVCELKQLMCLDAPVVKNFPVDRLGNLVHLEELMLQVHREEDADVFLVELGKLTRLRVLHILFHIDYHSMALVQSLNNLQEIRELIISHTDDTDDVCMAVDSTWKSWMAPRQLWRLETDMVLPSSQLVSCCRRLRYLNMFVAERVDMKILALLPELFYLQLHDPTYYGHYKDGCIIVGADGFKNLRICIVPRELKFLPGAMPRLESLRFVVCAAPAERRALDLGLGNLVSLKDVELVIDCCGCVHAEVEETKAVLTRAVEDHPNRPTIAFENLENYVEETLVSTAVWKSIQGL